VIGDDRRIGTAVVVLVVCGLFLAAMLLTMASCTGGLARGPLLD
jgi:hypothetical protein